MYQKVCRNLPSSVKKWTQTDLALRVDVDRNYVSLIELGRNSPSVRLMFQLCDALDITPSDMLKDVERRISVLAKARQAFED
ncbi:MAG: helix-turn-helix domain-containing protein [Pseudomonadales bacterium]|nr:helix-turn-helix transcriptional regulator [Delftia acidovorans]WAT88647.1 helix-turn-helix transcriptional regulator [Delftia acidovorans]